MAAQPLACSLEAVAVDLIAMVEKSPADAPSEVNELQTFCRAAVWLTWRHHPARKAGGTSRVDLLQDRNLPIWRVHAGTLELFRKWSGPGGRIEQKAAVARTVVDYRFFRESSQ